MQTMETGRNNYKKYISENEEIRNGFKVSTNRKKIWNFEINILEEFKRICKKHNIKYYAQGGTLLGAIRHKGFIPRDDDIDIIMTREDYEKFIKISEEELPKNMVFSYYHQGWGKISNIDTSALGDDNRWDKDFVGGINIDLFPTDYASKYEIINKIKSIILLSLRSILLAQKAETFVKRMKKWKRFVAYTCKFLFKKIDSKKIYNLHERISKKTFFKSDKIYNTRCPYKFYPVNIFDKSHDVEFETTTICIPDGYDTYLKLAFGDYMKPVIFEGGHHCWYSIDKSYKDIIKKFDRNKSNEENYNNCKDLFIV